MGKPRADRPTGSARSCEPQGRIIYQAPPAVAAVLNLSESVRQIAAWAVCLQQEPTGSMNGRAARGQPPPAGRGFGKTAGRG